MNPDISPALLTKTEIDWLQHKIKVSKVYEYRLKSDIKKKLQAFQQLELPLLMKNGFISSNDDLSVYTQNLSANPQSLQRSNKATNKLLFTKQRSLGRDLDPGPLPYQGNAIRSIDLIERTGIINATTTPNLGQASLVFCVGHSFWKNYKEYLSRNFNRHTAKCRLIYSKDFSYVLNESNASSLLRLSNEKRIHVMKALASLSKYTGCYDRWKDIINRYQLKWSNEDTVGAFNDVMMMNGEHNYSSMITWLKDTYSKLLSSYGNILLFNTLTGLRPDEACKSIMLMHEQEVGLKCFQKRITHLLYLK